MAVREENSARELNFPVPRKILLSGEIREKPESREEIERETLGTERPVSHLWGWLPNIGQGVHIEYFLGHLLDGFYLQSCYFSSQTEQ